MSNNPDFSEAFPTCQGVDRPAVLGILLANKTEARRSCLTNDVDLIDQFVSRYRHEFDFFEQAGRLVALHLDTRLQASGIRAIVTSRAKNPKRLEEKVRQRAADRPYKSVEEIYADIVDLAGVRVALYFPGERNEVDKIIRDQFNLTTAKDFTGTSKPAYSKRFSGTGRSTIDFNYGNPICQR